MRQPPGVGTALVADTQILEALCCACQTVGDADLQGSGGHPGATIASLIPSLPLLRKQTPEQLGKIIKPSDTAMGAALGPSHASTAWAQRATANARKSTRNS